VRETTLQTPRLDGEEVLKMLEQKLFPWSSRRPRAFWLVSEMAWQAGAGSGSSPRTWPWTSGENAVAYSGKS